jgi:subtilisin family serine protease
MAILAVVFLRPALFASAFALGTRPAPSFDAPYVPDEVLVKFSARASAKAIQQSLAAVGAQTVSAPALAPLGVSLLKVPSGKVRDVVIRLNQTPAVEFAEPNYRVTVLDTIPNDPGWSAQYGPARIQAPQAWDVITGTSAVTIAVIDTGVDLAHPDLASKIWTNPGETGGGKETNGVDDDGDGYVDDWRGWDFVNADNLPQDDNSHGSHVAGIAAAATNNSAGIAGMAWGARVMALKVLDAAGNGTTASVGAAITWAANHGAKVINLSLGTSAPALVMEDAVNYAYASGVVVAAAAGNNGPTVFFPGAYEHALAVAATDENDNHASYSNVGPEVDLAAPGSSIYSTVPGGYGYKSGTSMATPHVAGVAALLAGLPQFNTVDKIIATLELTALDFGDPGPDSYYGYGLVQAYDAVIFDPSTITPTPTPPPPPPYTLGTSKTCPAEVLFNWVDATGGTNPLFSDDSSISVPLPFPFIFGGQAKTAVIISANGYLTFGNNGSAYENAAIPSATSPNDFIAPFWDDLNPGAGGGIYYQTVGAAPSRRFVVEWRRVPRFTLSPPGGEGELTFEAILFEGAHDIVFQYQALNGPQADGGSATVGIEFGSGVGGVQYAHNTPGVLWNGLALKFSPASDGTPTPTPAPTCGWAYLLPWVGK